MANLTFLIVIIVWSAMTTFVIGYFLQFMGMLRIRCVCVFVCMPVCTRVVVVVAVFVALSKVGVDFFICIDCACLPAGR